MGLSLAYAGMIDDHMRKMGQVDDRPAVAEVVRPGKKEFVVESFDGVGVWVIPAWLESESNRGGQLKGVIQRKAAVKKAVWKALGPHWRAFGPVGDAIRSGAYAAITVTRMGGRGLDTGNLWRAVKPVEDAIAILLGVDDGLPGWRSAFSVGQEPGPLWGVRVEMRTASPLRGSKRSGSAVRR